MTIKYLLQPGWVVSSTDQQDHYVDFRQLAWLYGVPLDECVIETERNVRLGWKSPEGLIALRPRYDGNYKLKEHDT